MSSSTIQIMTGDNHVVVYDAQGNANSVGPDSTHVFDIEEGGFCTISVPADIEDNEHPPEEIPEFAQKMIEFWQDFFAALKHEIQDPVATPTKE